MPTGEQSGIKPASQLAAELRGETESQLDTGDPRDQKEFTFELSYTDPRGKRWSGRFTNRILSILDRQRVKVLKARMSGGLPVAALDADIWTLNEMIAHLSISLIKRPIWAEELTDLYDEDLIGQIYEEVAAHEARFFRRRPDPKEDKKP